MPAAPATRRADPALLYLASFFVVGLAASILGPSVTILRERTGSSIGAIGALFLFQSIGYIAGSIGGGRGLDRVGGHRLFLAGLCLMGAALIMVPVMRSLAGLAVVFVVLGVGGGVVDVGANTMLVWSRGRDVAPIMNLLHLCFGIGALSSPLLVNIDLEVACWSGVAIAGVCAVWSQYVHAPLAPTVLREEHTDATPRLLALAAVFFVLYVGLEIGFAGWIHTYGEEIDFTATGAAWLTATFWASFTVGRLAAAAVSRRVEPRPMLIGACTLAVAAVAAMAIADGAAAPVWVTTALFGIAAAPQFPVMITYMERHVQLSGEATSWFVGGAGLGGLIFPWLIGLWFGRSGASAMPFGVLLLAIATLGWFVVVDRALRTRRAAAAELGLPSSV